MRHLFIAFLIALLPLRSWVSDAMATTMSAYPADSTLQVATKMVASDVYQSGIKDHTNPESTAPAAIQAAVNCAEHATTADVYEADLHCDSCSACQTCHAVALCPSTADVAAVFSLNTLPRTAAAQFSSASTAFGEKPPIS